MISFGDECCLFLLLIVLANVNFFCVCVNGKSPNLWWNSSEITENFQ